MQTASEYRRRAREALEGNIFGNTWLFMVLVVLVTGAILGVSGVIFIGPLLLIGPISIGICSYTLHVVRNTAKKNKIDPPGSAVRWATASWLGFLPRYLPPCGRCCLSSPVS